MDFVMASSSLAVFMMSHYQYDAYLSKFSNFFPRNVPNDDKRM